MKQQVKLSMVEVCQAIAHHVAVQHGKNLKGDVDFHIRSRITTSDPVRIDYEDVTATFTFEEVP